MIVEKIHLVKLLKDLSKGIEDIDCKKYYIDFKIIGVDEEFSKQSPHLKSLILKVKEAHA
jgi:hypothetical protein